MFAAQQLQAPHDTRVVRVFVARTYRCLRGACDAPHAPGSRLHAAESRPADRGGADGSSACLWFIHSEPVVHASVRNMHLEPEKNLKWNQMEVHLQQSWGLWVDVVCPEL